MKLLSIGSSAVAYVAEHLGFLEVYSLVRRSLAHSQIAIIGYHRVSSADPPWYIGCVIKPEIFEREIAYLCKVTRVVSLDWLVERLHQGKQIPTKVACITFDDGFKDIYTTAYPILRKYNVPATIFLTTGYLGRSWPCLKARFAIWNTHVTKIEVEGLGNYSLKSVSDRVSAMLRIELALDELAVGAKDLAIERLLRILDVDFPSKFEEGHTLSWDEILEMSQNEISFGAHTVTHTNLTKLPIDELRKEIVQSKKDIERKLGIPCTLFSYPNGKCNNEIIKIVKESGFKGAVGGSPIPITPNQTSLFTLYRIPGTDFHTFQAYYSGLYVDLIKVLLRGNK